MATGKKKPGSKRKSTKKKRPARKRADAGLSPARAKPVKKTTEAILLDVVKALREDPERYQQFRKSMLRARTDEERVKVLLHFATREEELAALIPITASGVEAAAWTTVTVTTVLIPDTAY